MAITIELSRRDEVLELNRRRWEELVNDPELARIPGRVETNRHGQILMSPPPSGAHSSLQGRILLELNARLSGRVLPECPISTLDGVRAADVGWYSVERFREVDGQSVFETAPEICVEVASPSNSAQELAEKASLYFEAGACEVWICDLEGRMGFFLKNDPLTKARQSVLCPDFPARMDAGGPAARE